MKVKTWLPIGLALVLGVLAAKLAKDAVSSRKGGGGTAMVKIVVAKRPIAPGESLSATDIELRSIAAEAPPEGASTEVGALVGRTTQTQLVKGQPVLEAMLASAGSASGLQALVPSGLRAMTIEVNEFSSVAGMVMPGSRVDVISVMQDPHHNESMSRTIVQNVLVKAVGQSTSSAKDPEKEESDLSKSVTLIVTPKQAEAIQLSTLSGRPWLVLRGEKDNSIAALAGTTLTELRGAPPSYAREETDPHSKVVPTVETKPATQPATPAVFPVMAPSPVPSNWNPPRAVHTIRATVENTVSVTPTQHANRDIFSGAEIEP